MTDVIREIRAIREAFAAAHGYDVRAMGAALREKSAREGQVTVTLPPRPVVWPVVTRPPEQPGADVALALMLGVSPMGHPVPTLGAEEARMDSVERFAAEAVAYREWAARGTDVGGIAARNALLHITRLYLAALELPPAWSEELADQPCAERVGDDEVRAVFAAAGRLPLDCYGAVFDPSVVPPDEPPVVRSLSDDIADIYRDVVSGLWAFEAGRRAAAVWEWGFGFRHHWGEHATGAIRALHAWLATNAFDRLASDAEIGPAPDQMNV